MACQQECGADLNAGGGIENGESRYFISQLINCYRRDDCARAVVVQVHWRVGLDVAVNVRLSLHSECAPELGSSDGIDDRHICRVRPPRLGIIETVQRYQGTRAIRHK